MRVKPADSCLSAVPPSLYPFSRLLSLIPEIPPPSLRPLYHKVAGFGLGRTALRQACRIVKQSRGTQRYPPAHRTEEDALTRDIIALASKYGRYGYRRITALLQAQGWAVGGDRVQRIWRREGLKVPQKQHPRARLGYMHANPVKMRTGTPSEQLALG